jgi:hypothetical protein
MKHNLLGGFADFALGALAALFTMCSVLLYLILYGGPDKPTRPKPKKEHEDSQQ